VIVLGLQELLRARADMKSEFRIEKTMIGARNNNALKFCPTPEMAVQAIFGLIGRGYKPPGETFAEALSDVQSHQIALLSAAQAAMQAMLSQFDPKELKGRLENESFLSSLMPGNRRARYWDAYEQSYEAIKSEAQENFAGIFWKEFAKVYAENSRQRGGD